MVKGIRWKPMGSLMPRHKQILINHAVPLGKQLIGKPCKKLGRITPQSTKVNCFKEATHLLWHCFDNLMQCHNIYLHPELHSLLSKILYWWQSRTIPSVFFQHTPNNLNGVKVRTLLRPINVWKWLLVLPHTHVSSCSALSQLEPDESWHCCPGICLSHQDRNNPLMG